MTRKLIYSLVLLFALSACGNDKPAKDNQDTDKDSTAASAKDSMADCQEDAEEPIEENLQDAYSGSDYAGSYLYGTSVLKGFYVQAKKDNFGEQVVCDGLVITGGSERLEASYRKRVDEGNTLNFINENDQVVVNLRLDNLSESMQAKIKASTAESPVRLDVEVMKPLGTEVGPCFSDIKVLAVK